MPFSFRTRPPESGVPSALVVARRSHCAPLRRCRQWMVLLLAMLSGLLLSGCGKTIRSDATEQLILSDAVDRSVRNIDFSPLSGRDCFLDTTYLKTTKSPTFVNADYLTSSLRNQALAAGCHLVEKETEAELIIEPRVGTLGADIHDVTYGIPSNNVDQPGSFGRCRGNAVRTDRRPNGIHPGDLDCPRRPYRFSCEDCRLCTRCQNQTADLAIRNLCGQQQCARLVDHGDRPVPERHDL